MVKCGSCGEQHATAAEVRDCYAAAQVEQSRFADQRALAQESHETYWGEVDYGEFGPATAPPEGRYALRVAGVVRFYRVKYGRKPGIVFLDAQASDDHWPIRALKERSRIYAAIAADLDGARQLYARKLGRCYICGKTLTDELSRKLGVGPVCRDGK